MARLMVVSIQNRGDAVLIVTRHSDVDLIGFVARTVLRGFFQENPSMCKCISFVDLNLTKFVQILLPKTPQLNGGEEQMQCVEITASDLAEAIATAPHIAQS